MKQKPCYSSGTYQIQEADGVQLGTKIVIHLKTDSREFSDDKIVEGKIQNINIQLNFMFSSLFLYLISGIIKKYSNFVGSPIYLNGQKANAIMVIIFLHFLHFLDLIL